MKKKSILWVSHSKKASGGAELSLITCAETALKMGYSVTVAVPDEGPMAEALRQKGISVRVIQYGWWVLGNISLRGSLKNFRALITMRSLIREIDPDVIITNTMVVPWFALLAQLHSAAHVWHIRELGKSDHGFRYILPERLIYSTIASTSDRVIVNSTSVKNFLLEKLPGKSITISYPYVKLPAALPTSKHSNKKTRLIVVGGIAPGKGQLEAVHGLEQAARTLGKKHQIHLNLVGPYSNAYKKEIDTFVELSDHITEKDITFHGLQKNPFAFLADADIYIMCSRNEAFGRVTIEAMATGLPVLGTNTGGTPEIVQDNTTGYLYERGNTHQLGDFIVQLHKNPRLRKKLGAAGKKKVADSFSLQACLDPMFDVVEQAHFNSKLSKGRVSLLICATLLASVFFSVLKAISLRLKQLCRLMRKIRIRARRLTLRFLGRAKRLIKRVVRKSTRLMRRAARLTLNALHSK